MFFKMLLHVLLGLVSITADFVLCYCNVYALYDFSKLVITLRVQCDLNSNQLTNHP